MSTAARGNGAPSVGGLCFDFVDPGAPACGMVRLGAGSDGGAAEALLLTPGATIPASSSDAAISVDDDGTRASIVVEANGGGFEAELTRLLGATVEPGTAFSDATGIAEELFAARTDFRWRAGETAGEAAGVGRIVRTTGELDWERVELVRELAVTLDDGSLLAVASARPAGAAGHDAEAASAVLAEADGAVSRFEDPLVSTEYDSGGAQRRVGVELWPPDPDAVAVRGAGTLLASSDGVAFLSFSLDGRTGTARYEMHRRG